MKYTRFIAIGLALTFALVSSCGADVTTGYGPAHRDIRFQDNDTYTVGTEVNAAKAVYIGPNMSYIDEAAREINLPIGSFTTAGILMLGNSTPKLVTNNSMAAVVWVQGDTDSIESTFRIPADYHSGGRFKIITDVSASATDLEMDFDVYVNSLTTVAAWDSSATNQTPVQIKNDGAGAALGIGSPEEDTLTVATDFASLAVGDQVTISLWLSTDSTGAADLELYSVKFEYNY